jgi:hypothetical protein
MCFIGSIDNYGSERRSQVNAPSIGSVDSSAGESSPLACESVGPHVQRKLWRRSVRERRNMAPRASALSEEAPSEPGRTRGGRALI